MWMKFSPLIYLWARYHFVCMGQMFPTYGCMNEMSRLFTVRKKCSLELTRWVQCSPVPALEIFCMFKPWGWFVPPSVVYLGKMLWHWHLGYYIIPVKLPWTFPGPPFKFQVAQLTFNGAPENTQGNLAVMLCERGKSPLTQGWNAP